jgi:hypothetical protein
MSFGEFSEASQLDLGFTFRHATGLSAPALQMKHHVVEFIQGMAQKRYDELADAYPELSDPDAEEELVILSF